MQKRKVRRETLSWIGKYIYMLADELARARDACDALRSDDPLQREMRTRLEMTCAGDARPHAMRIWGVVVMCVLAGLVFAVAAAAVEVCNDGHCVKRAWHASRSGRTLERGVPAFLRQFSSCLARAFPSTTGSTASRWDGFAVKDR